MDLDLIEHVFDWGVVPPDLLKLYAWYGEDLRYMRDCASNWVSCGTQGGVSMQVVSVVRHASSLS